MIESLGLSIFSVIIFNATLVFSITLILMILILLVQSFEKHRRIKHAYN